MNNGESEIGVDPKILIEMHKFYAEEARHQRRMMWETARWFTLILGILLSIVFKMYSEIRCAPPPAELHQLDVLILLIPSALGYLVAFICVDLMRSFYGTNLKYISMFAKIENELEFNNRTKKEVFRSDPLITWQRYMSERTEAKCSQDFVREGLKYTQFSMYSIMSIVFLLFLISFLILGCVILYNAYPHLKIKTVAPIIVAIIIWLSPIFYLVIKKSVNKRTKGSRLHS